MPVDVLTDETVVRFIGKYPEHPAVMAMVMAIQDYDFHETPEAYAEVQRAAAALAKETKGKIMIEYYEGSHRPDAYPRPDTFH